MKKALIILSVLFLTSCDSNWSPAHGTRTIDKDDVKYKIELYSGGTKIREWISTGKVSKKITTGYYFIDNSSKVSIEVSGDIIITRID